MDEGVRGPEEVEEARTLPQAGHQEEHQPDQLILAVKHEGRPEEQVGGQVAQPGEHAPTRKQPTPTRE